ncbi:MAG: plasmid pRiA4b ORF-3 family protein [Planctomycetota bacterium]|nr:plasmid pRiA4b ORF-3 family protein [Planctomycetota bacterium]
MSKRQHIRPGEEVPLKLTATERKLILEKVSFIDNRYEALIREAPDGGPLMMTLDDYDEFGGYIAAEANHCDDRKFQKKLDAIFGKVQAVLDNYTDEKSDNGGLSMSEARDRLTNAMNALMAGQNPGAISIQLQPEFQTQSGSIKLTPLQRETLIDHTELRPAIRRKLKKAENGTQTISFSRDELNEIHDEIGDAVNYARHKERQRLMAIQKKVVSILQKDHAALFEPPKSKAKKRKSTGSGDIFQFRIKLKNIEPSIWRRIQVRDCTLDELHEHIQAAMGWENCHLHRFTINGVEFGPVSLDAMPFGPELEDETSVFLSDVLAQKSKQFRFGYTYDFGDDWLHEVLFEGTPDAVAGQEYPVCLEGERACPPEDMGGPWGFADYLEALADQHAEMIEWRGRFRAEDFSAEGATLRMQRTRVTVR